MGLLLDVIAKPTLILMSAAGLAMLLRGFSASLRHAIWILALVSAALLPLAAVMMPQLEWSSVPGGRTSVTFFHTENVQASPSMSELGTGAAVAYAPGTRWFQPVFVWPLGVAFLLLRIVMGTLAVRRLEREVVPTPHGTWFSTIKELSVALGIEKPVRLLFTAKQVSPMTWGLMRHTILLPAASVAWSDERRRIVLAHELAHLKRKDGLTQITRNGGPVTVSLNVQFHFTLNDDEASQGSIIGLLVTAPAP